MKERSFPIQAVVTVLFLFVIFALGVTKIEDTDAWMHLSLGKAIWLNKGLPAVDPHVFTSSDRPFFYTSWLYAVLYYTSYVMLDVYGIIFLKALMAASLFAVLLRDSLRPFRNITISIFVLSIISMMVRFRIVDRPDLFAMTFLAVSVFSLNAYRYDGKNYLFALPAVHLLWANMHSSIVLMAVPFLAILIGGALDRRFRRADASGAEIISTRQLGTVAAVMLASAGAALLNPNGIAQFLYGTSVLSTPFYKQVIMEFAPVTWSHSKWPFFIAAGTLLSFGANRRRFSFADLLLTAPFLLLPFLSIRFAAYQGIIVGPVIVRNLSQWLAIQPRWTARLGSRQALAIAGLWAVLCGALSITNTVVFADSSPKPGLGFSKAAVPEDALRFMDREGITGRIFNLFEWGGYIAWRDHPRRSIFVDPRGDIPAELFEYLVPGQYPPEALDDIATRYGIDSMLLRYTERTQNAFDRTGSGTGDDGRWALVYWDDLSLLYLKRGGPYDQVARHHEFRFARPDRRIPDFSLMDPVRRTEMKQEIQRAVQETGSALSYMLLGAFSSGEGKYEEALAAYRAALEKPFVNRSAVLAGIGFSLDRLGSRDEALQYYRKSLAIKQDPSLEYLIAKQYLDRGDTRNAVHYFEQALEHNPRLVAIYPILIGLYQGAGKTEAVRRTSERYRQTAADAAGEDHFRAGLQAYGAKDYRAAVECFEKSLEVNPWNAAAYSNIGYAYYDMGVLEQAGKLQRKAIEIDPTYANAYYGLALILKRQGDRTSAKQAWSEYLRLEPSGYYSRRALMEIRELDAHR